MAFEINKVLTIGDGLDEDKRIYFLTHPELDKNGNEKMKTAGQLVDSLVTPEGYFNFVLGCEFKNGKHWYKVNKDGPKEIFKTPMGMFNDKYVPSDLQEFDNLLCKYYGIDKQNDEDKLKEIRELNDSMIEDGLKHEPFSNYVNDKLK